MNASNVVTAMIFRCAYRAVLLCCCVLTAGVWSSGCSEKNWRPASDAVHTVADLKALKGKTRDEVREYLGEPKGLYTIDAKGRWHYPHMKIEDTETRETYEATVLLYFSQLGEQRVTIIEIKKRTE